jgi:hypothetical protein
VWDGRGGGGLALRMASWGERQAAMDARKCLRQVGGGRVEGCTSDQRYSELSEREIFDFERVRRRQLKACCSFHHGGSRRSSGGGGRDRSGGRSSGGGRNSGWKTGATYMNGNLQRDPEETKATLLCTPFDFELDFGVISVEDRCQVGERNPSSTLSEGLFSS